MWKLNPSFFHYSRCTYVLSTPSSVCCCDISAWYQPVNIVVELSMLGLPGLLVSRTGQLFPARNWWTAKISLVSFLLKSCFFSYFQRLFEVKIQIIIIKKSLPNIKWKNPLLWLMSFGHCPTLSNATHFEPSQFHEVYTALSNMLDLLLDCRRKSQNWRYHQLWMWKSNQKPLFLTSQVKLTIFFLPVFITSSFQSFAQIEHCALSFSLKKNS